MHTSTDSVEASQFQRQKGTNGTNLISLSDTAYFSESSGWFFFKFATNTELSDPMSCIDYSVKKIDIGRQKEN